MHTEKIAKYFLGVIETELPRWAPPLFHLTSCMCTYNTHNYCIYVGAQIFPSLIVCTTLQIQSILSKTKKKSCQKKPRTQFSIIPTEAATFNIRLFF